MENVPWHEEVISFVKELGDLLPDYEIASEHEHSNCVLLAHRKVMHNSQAVLCCGCRSLSERSRISPVYVFLTIGDIAPFTAFV
jgi:wyosine [tRNA(Phe)-imidazoG37] synthetase (radical SAM superfamily)